MPYVGTVVNGILNSGKVKTGDMVLFGPDANGHFQSTMVRSMQRKRRVTPFQVNLGTHIGTGQMCLLRKQGNASRWHSSE